MRTLLKLSKQEAKRLGHDYVGTEHILLALIRDDKGPVGQLLNSLGVNLSHLKKAIEAAIPGKGWTFTVGRISLTEEAEKALDSSIFDATLHDSKAVDERRILLSLLKDKDCLASKVLHEFSVHYDDVARVMGN